MANAEFFSKMKDGSIFLNTARGELQDNEAILAALKSGKLDGYGTDVFANETSFFFKKLASAAEISDPTVRELVQMYPNMKLIGSMQAFKMMNQFYRFETDSRSIVEKK